MDQSGKNKFITDIRSIISNVDISTLDENPKEELMKQQFYKVKAILSSFNPSLGKRMGELMYSLQYPDRSNKQIDAVGLRNWVIEKVEELSISNVYRLDLPQSKKIKKILTNSEFKIQSNIDGNDEHIMIFDKENTTGEHVHLILDGDTGEVRIDPKDKMPHDLLSKVETILVMKNGMKVRSTRNTLEFLDGEGTSTNIPILDILPPIGISGSANGHFYTFTIKNLSHTETAIDCVLYIRGFNYLWKSSIKPSLTLESQKTTEIIYKISDEKVFHENITDLSLVMEYKDLNGNSYHTRRMLVQELAPSESFYQLSLGTFHPAARNIDDKFQPISELFRDEDIYKTQYSIGEGSNYREFIIGISRYLLKCWEFSTTEEITYALNELASRKIRKIIKDKTAIDQYIFIADNLSAEFTEGREGYNKTRNSL